MFFSLQEAIAIVLKSGFLCCISILYQPQYTEFSIEGQSQNTKYLHRKKRGCQISGNKTIEYHT